MIGNHLLMQLRPLSHRLITYCGLLRAEGWADAIDNRARS